MTQTHHPSFARTFDWQKWLVLIVLGMVAAAGVWYLSAQAHKTNYYFCSCPRFANVSLDYDLRPDDNSCSFNRAIVYSATIGYRLGQSLHPETTSRWKDYSCYTTNTVD